MPPIKKSAAYTVQGRYKHKVSIWAKGGKDLTLLCIQAVEIKPGPKYNTRGLTRYGVDRPTDGTMGNRYNIYNPVHTPGPVDYSKFECGSTMGSKIRPTVSKRLNDLPTTPDTTSTVCRIRSTSEQYERFSMKNVVPLPGPGQYQTRTSPE